MAKKYCNENNLKFKVVDFGTVSHQELNKLIENNSVKITKWM